MKQKIGLLYLGLHNQLFKKYGGTIITRKEFFCKLGKHYMIPKSLREYVMKEMCDAELITKVDRDNIQILKSKIDIERDHNKICKMAGLL
jgi:hypothetical protein